MLFYIMTVEYFVEKWFLCPFWANVNIMFRARIVWIFNIKQNNGSPER
tara:strand:- start:38 stop:181 length:144 start_codon:yes stop_codon:yes gene_type:complete